MNAKFEAEADEFSRNCLIPAKDFKNFVAPDKYISDAEIVAFAKSIGSRYSSWPSSIRRYHSTIPMFCSEKEI